MNSAEDQQKKKDSTTPPTNTLPLRKNIGILIMWGLCYLSSAMGPAIKLYTSSKHGEENNSQQAIHPLITLIEINHPWRDMKQSQERK